MAAKAAVKSLHAAGVLVGVRIFRGGFALLVTMRVSPQTLAASGNYPARSFVSGWII
jgi:hypothetical protein